MRIVRLLSPLVAAAVLVFIFTHVVHWSDERVEVVIVSIDDARRMAIVRETQASDDGETVNLPWAQIEALQVFTLPPTHAPPGSDTSTDIAALTGTRTMATRHGLKHYLTTLPWWSLAGMLAFTGLALALQVARMRVLLRALGVQLGWFDTSRATAIGLFYGNVLPAGQVGGDPVKALYIASWSRSSRGGALAAAMLDRGIGLLALAMLALIGVWTDVSDGVPSRVTWTVLALLGGISLLLAVALSRRTRRAMGVTRALKRFPVLETFGEALRTARKRLPALARALVLSLPSQALLVLAVAAVGEAIGVGRHGGVPYFLLVPVANVVASLPGAPPGGWGVGEGAFIVLFQVYGVPPEEAVALSVVSRAGMLAWSLLGAPALLMKMKPAPAVAMQPDPPAMQEAGLP